MDQLHVGTTVADDRGLYQWINDVSPRIELVDISSLLRAERDSESARAQMSETLANIEVLFMAGAPRELSQRAPKLKWIQWIGTGVDRMAQYGLLGQAFTVTNAAGTNALPIAEHCLHFMLMFVKRAAISVDQQKRHSYERTSVRPDFLEGKTVGVLGQGAIGRETARLCKAFRMRVLATRRSATVRATGTGDVDEMYPPSQLHDLLRECDFVVDALPLTPETTHIIGAAELAAMKSTAYLINVGRGKQIDEVALVQALRDGTIAGAGLDVFETEPLPEDSPLWDMPSVHLTPHVAGDLIDNRLRATRFFCANLKRYLAGEPLENVVDPKLGY